MSQLEIPDEIAIDLEKLHKCHFFLQTLNEELQSRPFSFRIQNQFDAQIKQSQYLIKKLTNAFKKHIRNYEKQTKYPTITPTRTTTATTQQPLLPISENTNTDSKTENEKPKAIPKPRQRSRIAPFNSGIILGFQDLCLRIEKEWRIGARLIEKQIIHDNEMKQEKMEKERLARIANKPTTKPPPPPKTAPPKTYHHYHKHSPAFNPTANSNSPHNKPMSPMTISPVLQAHEHLKQRKKSEKHDKSPKFVTIEDMSNDDNDNNENKRKKQEYLDSHATHDNKLKPVCSDDWNDQINSLLKEIETKNRESENYNNYNSNDNNNNSFEDELNDDSKEDDEILTMKQLNLLELAPANMESELNYSILSINEKLQDLMQITSDLDDLINEQQSNIDEIEENIENANENVIEAASTLTTIRKSPLTYALFGGLGAMALGGPVLMLGVGVKAAIGGSIGFGALGALSGGTYAGMANKQMQESNETLKQIENENKQRKIERAKRRKTTSYGDNDDNNNDDDNEPLLTNNMIINAGLSPINETNEENIKAKSDKNDSITKTRKRRVSFPIVSKTAGNDDTTNNNNNNNNNNEDEDSIEPWNPRSVN